MKRYYPILMIVLTLALVQMACNLPSGSATGGIQATPTITLPAVFTATSPAVVTATTNPTATLAAPTQQSAPTQPPAPTATTRPSTGNNNTPAVCTYRATFVADITIGDDTVFRPNSNFQKIWRLRNDGTCTWGPNYPLHAVAFTGGSKLSAPDQLELPGVVSPGQSVDIAINMAAPASSGTYVSEWKFRVDNDPAGRGPYIGLGAGNQPFYARIIVQSETVPTPTNTPTTGPSITRINVGTGKTHAAVSGTLASNETRGFVVNAMKEQILMASVGSFSNEAKVKITTANGTALGSGSNNNSSTAQILLPSTGDYVVWVTAGAQSTNFTLGVTIPARISFAPGAISATVSGGITGREPVTYVLRAMSGQTMTVNLTGSVGPTIYGYTDGQPLVRSQSGVTNWSGVLPATQDYIIIVDPSVETTNYTMKVTVETLSYP